MAAFSGNNFLFKVGNGGDPETFASVGGIKNCSFTLNNATVDVTTKDSTHWQTLLAGGGVKSMTISADGVFTDTASELTLQGYATANTINNYQIISGNGDTIAGAFQIDSYGRGGNNDAEETFTISLASSGAITFTAA